MTGCGLSKQPLSNFQSKNSCPVSNVAKEEVNRFIWKETKGSQKPRSAKKLSLWDCGQVVIKLGTKLVIYQIKQIFLEKGCLC